MRLPTLLLACLALSLVACGDRQNLAAVPDRGGHAYVDDSSGAASGSGIANAGPAVSTNPEPGPGETVITLEYGDAGWKVADRHGVSVRWLVERNQLTRRAQPGDRLIVPASGR